MASPSTLRITISTPIVAALSLAASSIEAASFDCTKAAKSVEKLICNDKELSDLDKRLGQVYTYVLDTTKDKPAVRREQIAWLKDRDTCNSRGCLKNLYERRNFQLMYPGIADEQGKPEEIRRLLKDSDLVPAFGSANPICEGFLRDFRDQKNIEHVVPVIQTDDYSDPRLLSIKKACPNLKLNKHVHVSGGSGEDRDYLFRKEKEGGASGGDKSGDAVLFVDYGSKNFRVWRIDAKDDPKELADVIFYDEWKWQRGNMQGTWMGYHRVINISDCTDGYIGAGLLESSGVIRYSGRTMIYGFWISDQSLRSLMLWHWEKLPTGFENRQQCVFNLRDPRRAQ